MYCKHCGKELDDRAIVCPGCGIPTTEKKEKKKHPVLGSIILVLSIILIIGSCSSAGSPQKVGSSAGSSSSDNLSNDFSNKFEVGDKVELNNIVVTLKKVSENRGGNYMTPSSGKVFIVCEFEIENNSSKDIVISSLMSFEAYVDDYTTEMNLSAMLSTGKQQLDGTVAAGKKMSGVIGYEADPGWEEIEIRFTPDFWAGKDIIFAYKK
ncbi:MAG: DUF5067 domain-containing protein [Eubacterium sp.]